MHPSDCLDHDWQPAEDLQVGRYRCSACESLGWRHPKTGVIAPYKSRPAGYITGNSSFMDYPSFYPVGDHGKCPSMDDQERRFLGGELDDTFLDSD